MTPLVLEIILILAVSLIAYELWIISIAVRANKATTEKIRVDTEKELQEIWDEFKTRRKSGAHYDDGMGEESKSDG